jgi:hypothetical protein
MKDELFPTPIKACTSIESVLLAQTNGLIANSNISQASFVHELLLPGLINAGLEQQGQYHTAAEYEKWHGNKVRQINNVLNKKTNVPARWVTVWLSVLPAPYGPAARKQILNLMGALDLPNLSSLSKQSENADLASLLREVADVMEAGAGAAADGKYDSNDDPGSLRKLSDELVDVLEHSIGQLFAIGQAVDLQDERAGLVLKAVKQQ